MTTERRSESEVDEQFWAIVEEGRVVDVEPVDVPTPLSGRSAALVAGLAAAAGVFAAVVLFRVHLVVGILWLYLGVPGLVLASVCPVGRLRDPGPHGRRCAPDGSGERFRARRLARSVRGRRRSR